MRCTDLLDALSDYVDGELDPSMCKELEAHLGGCDSCRVVVDTCRKTIHFYKGEQECELPLQFREKLHQSLKDRWKQVHGDCD